MSVGSSPQQGVSIGLVDSAGNLITAPNVVAATSGPDGSYEIQHLLPGSYKVVFAAGAADLATQYYDDATGESAATSVTVGAGQTNSGINASLIPGGEITGTVTNASSQAAVPGVIVDLLNAQGQVLEASTTLADGTYTLTSVPAGSYFVGFDPGGAFAGAFQPQYYSASQTLANAKAVSVSVGQVTGQVSVALVPTAATVQTTTTNTTTTTTNPVLVPYPVAVAPTLTSRAPTISGTVKVGDKLTAGTAGWTAGTTFSYQWYAAGKPITGATGATLTLAGAQYRRAITVAVLGKLSGYNWVFQTSAGTRTVLAGTLKTAVPKISGTVRSGNRLTAKPGTWTKGTRFTYQWYVGKRAIRGATRATLRLGAAQVNRSLTVRVTGRLAGYGTVTRTSHATQRVGPQPTR